MWRVSFAEFFGYYFVKIEIINILGISTDYVAFRVLIILMI